jgi:hypothetical protein
MSTKIKNGIVQHLIKKGNYEPDVDDMLIDVILENIRYGNLMRANLDEKGCVLNERSGNNVVVTKTNPAFNVYQMCLRNVNEASAKLGISRKDRIALKLIEVQKEDDFDD